MIVGPGNLGRFTKNDVVNWKFTVLVADVPTTLAGSPVVKAYESGSSAEFATGITLTADYDGVTGLCQVVADTSTVPWQAGKFYDFLITAGDSHVGCVVGHLALIPEPADLQMVNGGSTGTTAGVLEVKQIVVTPATGETGIEVVSTNAPAMSLACDPGATPNPGLVITGGGTDGTNNGAAALRLIGGFGDDVKASGPAISATTGGEGLAGGPRAVVDIDAGGATAPSIAGVSIKGGGNAAGLDIESAAGGDALFLYSETGRALAAFVNSGPNPAVLVESDSSNAASHGIQVVSTAGDGVRIAGGGSGAGMSINAGVSGIGLDIESADDYALHISSINGSGLGVESANSEAAFITSSGEGYAGIIVVGGSGGASYRGGPGLLLKGGSGSSDHPGGDAIQLRGGNGSATQPSGRAAILVPGNKNGSPGADSVVSVQGTYDDGDYITVENPNATALELVPTGTGKAIDAQGQVKIDNTANDDIGLYIKGDFGLEVDGGALFSGRPFANLFGIKIEGKGTSPALTLSNADGDVGKAIEALGQIYVAPTNTNDDAIKLVPNGTGDSIDAPIEGSVGIVESLRLANAANGGKVDGAATTTVHIRNLADTKNRVTATVDASGNRTAVTRDLT